MFKICLKSCSLHERPCVGHATRAFEVTSPSVELLHDLCDVAAVIYSRMESTSVFEFEKVSMPGRPLGNMPVRSQKIFLMLSHLLK